ncbi:MAG: DUF2807 domain-containing protein [Cytophagales bacterium]|nr:DUF2807 domain-containing protein [Cytophagales bacterium]
MKKELIYYSILTLVIALLLAFETNPFDDKVKLISKVIETEAFEKLDIDLDCNIYVSLGEEQKVVFEGPSKYLRRVEANLEDGVLSISCKKPGVIAKWLNSSEAHAKSINVYVKLTHTNQLIKPRKGNVISNETLQLFDIKDNSLYSLEPYLMRLLKLMGNQQACIMLP